MDVEQLTDPETMKSFTYTELINRSEQMRNALIRLGIQHGDIIGTYAGNSSDYITFILAAIGIGVILMKLKNISSKASVKWLLTEEKLFEKIEHFKEKIWNKAQGIKCGRYEMVSLNNTDVVYGVLPYFHAGGLLTVTTLLLVPPVLKFLSIAPNLNPEAFRSLKYIFVGSAHVNESLIIMIKQRLPKTSIIQLYGTTEAGAFVFMQPLFSDGKTGSCGILLPNVECKIVKLLNNDECEEMEIGEIWLKTITMMQGYLEETIDINDVFIDGWYRTGDLGFYDSNQFIYITGRIKEMIKVSPYEIEEAIQELEDVELCAVIGIPDEYSGQLPKAYIQLRDGGQLNENTIHQLINTKFASYKQLKGGIQFISNMPLNSSGKISRMELLKLNEKEDNIV
ncbi:4-coumarate--CoA ligase 1 [Dirofilaria immitis]|nr:4-coumarate--CoA ligase 1 [Dirofilaria immitis]